MTKTKPTPGEWRIAIHGGAGVILRENLSAEQEAAYHAALEASLKAGADILAGGGSATDAIEAAIIVMEDDPLFNAGKGAVLTAARTHELDAAIMDGRDRNAGAVAGVSRVKNPILAARAVMERSDHVMFAGPGADAFAAADGLAQVPNSYFTTPRRLRSLEKVLSKPIAARTPDERHGTVGAIALDKDGNLAAGTSTGGMTAKAAGRIGDTPLIGAATYAENGVCAVSATGHGEYFIRVGVAKSICEQIRLGGQPPQVAADLTLGEVEALGGDGGIILMDGAGEVFYSMNSPGMYRGSMDASAQQTAIFASDQ